MTARELERLLIEHYGPDFRAKALVTPFGSFALADAFEECGLRDPQAPDDSPARGLWQMTSRFSPYPSRRRWDDWFDY